MGNIPLSSRRRKISGPAAWPPLHFCPEGEIGRYVLWASFLGRFHYSEAMKSAPASLTVLLALSGFTASSATFTPGGISSGRRIPSSAQPVQVGMIHGSTAGSSARAAARELAGSVRMGDMGWMAECMYPPLKSMLAQQMQARTQRGQEAALARRAMGLGKAPSAEEEARMEKALESHYRRIGNDMKRAGVAIESFTVGEPFAELELTPPGAMIPAGLNASASAETVARSRGERSRMVVLPTTLVLTAPDGKGGKARLEKKSYLYAVRDEASDNAIRRKRLNKWFFIDAATDLKTLRTLFPDMPLNMATPPTGMRVLQTL